MAVKPAIWPTEHLSADASCVTAACHSKFTTASQIHGPVAQKACDACHEPDSGGHKYPLKRSGLALCTFCRQVPGSSLHQQQAMDKKGCITCHDPHVSGVKFLL